LEIKIQQTQPSHWLIGLTVSQTIFSKFSQNFKENVS